MRSKRSDGQRTHNRLLAMAAEVFAEKGFRQATVAEICRRAKANVAAVNYHFGGKERLYIEAWRDAFRRSIEAHPPDGGVPADAPPEARLRGMLLSIMHRITDPHSHDLDIIQREMSEPSGLPDAAMREAIEPLRNAVAGLVRELLGADAGEEQVSLCRTSIMAQCFWPLLRRRRRKSLFRSSQTGGLPENVETFADHVVRFSLAGIREMRKKV